MFLKDLCDQYVAAGGTPLWLQKIVFGLSLIVWKLASYLATLVNLDSLEDAYISNQGHDVYIYFQEDDDDIEWSLFTPNQCPNLRTFGVWDVTKSVKRWIDALEPGYIRQFKAEYSSADDLNGITSKLGDTRSSSKSNMNMISVFTIHDFPPVEIRDVQALAINLEDSIPDFLHWVQELPALEQLFLLTRQITDVCSQSREDGFEHQLAAICKKLCYMKLNNEAWRIWRDKKDGNEREIRFERLDRFESSEVELFQRWGEGWGDVENDFYYPQTL